MKVSQTVELLSMDLLNPKVSLLMIHLKLSEWYAVIQDSYRYQWFSYVIASPIQQVDYETFVKEIIHPAGFIQFADLTIHSSVKTRTLTGERDLVTILIDPCAPFKLLAADGTPILAGTESGHKFILAKNEYCEDVPDPSTMYWVYSSWTSVDRYNLKSLKTVILICSLVSS